MRDRHTSFEWIERFGKVVVVFISMFSLPIAWVLLNEMSGKASEVFLGVAAFLLVYYLVLILSVKIVLYVLKGESFQKSGFNRKHYIAYITPIIILLILSLIFWFIVEPIEKNKEFKNLQAQYNVAVGEIEALQAQFLKCSTPALEAKFQEELRDCQLYKNKVKHDYNFCVSLTYVNSPASCLYENDYEKINCSEEVIWEKAKTGLTRFSLDKNCQQTLDKLNQARATIEAYQATEYR